MKGIIFFLLMAVSFFINHLFSSDSKDLKSALVDAGKMEKQYREMVVKYPIHLRGQKENIRYLLSWYPAENGKRGEILFISLILSSNVEQIERTKIDSSKFLDFLFKKGTLEVSKSKRLLPQGPLLAKVAADGQIEVALSIITDKEKLEIHLAHKIVVASLNALNFWDGNPNNTSEEQMYIYDIFRAGFSNWYDPEIQKAKADNFITQVKLMQLPEIIALQEIEYANGQNENFKEGSYFRIALEKLGYRYFYLGNQGKDNPTALTCAYISKYPGKNEAIPFNVDLPAFKSFSKKEREIAHYTTRDMQLFSLEYTGAKFHIINNHWRSQGCDDERNCDLSLRVRKANAETIKNFIASNYGAEEKLDLIITGDLNASFNDTPISLLGSSGREDMVQSGKDPALYYNLWYELPPSERWEVSHGGQLDTLAQMLLNRGNYDSYGLQYVNNSFSVVGHQGYARSFLLGADGTPFRWQEKRYRAEQVLDEKFKKLVAQTLSKRGCSTNSSKRNCRPLYFEFFGAGYTDHLPLVAEFNFIGDIFSTINPIRTNFTPSATADVKEIAGIDIPIETCQEKDGLVDVKNVKIDLKNLSEWFLKCVRIEEKNAPLPLKITGMYDTNYIEVGSNKFALTIVHAFDPREIKDGKIFGLPDDRMDAGSNMCFARKILQGEGGKLVSISGRLGIMDGMPAIVLAERADIILADLPYNKANSCQREIIDTDR
ncbi:MAG: hypothetical protein A2451_11225 [Bdellovibrionales bacterium RIFOXYC2_FULL_39_8]|nr:MAG: hypothetical protein A2451_11225 [Bdellovibrionales bacterium RIFOXYC2_FULL_39_8]